MIQIAIIIGLALFSAIVTFTTTDHLIIYDEEKKPSRQIFRKRKRWKVTRRLGLLLISFLGTIGVSIWQYYDLEAKEAEANRAAKIEQDNRDRLAEEKSNRRNDSTVKTITEALAKYNLRYDSANQRIEKALKDSLSRPRAIPVGPDPIFTICDDEEKAIRLKQLSEYEYNLYVQLCSVDAASTNYKLRLIGVLSNSFSDPEDFIYLGNREAIPNALKLATNQRVTQSFILPVFNVPTDNFLFLLLKGSHSSVNSNKTHFVDQIYYLNIKGNTNGTVSGETEKKIRSFIKKNEKSVR